MVPDQLQMRSNSNFNPCLCDLLKAVRYALGRNRSDGRFCYVVSGCFCFFEQSEWRWFKAILIERGVQDSCQPTVFDSDHLSRSGLTKKSFCICFVSLFTLPIDDSRTVTRQEVMGQMLLINGPNDRRKMRIIHCDSRCEYR